jgi:hypothetical protein
VVDNAGGVGLVYENDVHWTSSTRFYRPVTMCNDLVTDLLGTRLGPAQVSSLAHPLVSPGYEMGIPTAASSSMMSNAAPSETAEPVERDARSVLFPATSRQYSSIPSSLRGLHAQNLDHQMVESPQCLGLRTSKMRMTASALRKNAEE